MAHDLFLKPGYGAADGIDDAHTPFDGGKWPVRRAVLFWFAVSAAGWGVLVGGALLLL
jgi:hypothetical protein